MTESDFCDTGLSSADELKRTLVGSVSQDFLLGKFSTWHESCEAFYEDPHITVVRWTVFPKSKNIPGTVSKSVIALVVSGTGVLAAQAGRSATHAAGQVALCPGGSSFQCWSTHWSAAAALGVSWRRCRVLTSGVPLGYRELTNPPAANGWPAPDSLFLALPRFHLFKTQQRLVIAVHHAPLNNKLIIICL